MPIEILVDTMIQDKIIEGLKSTSNDKSVPCFLEAIALGVQESTKLQRDILSILEEWQENQSVRKDSTEAKE